MDAADARRTIRMPPSSSSRRAAGFGARSAWRTRITESFVFIALALAFACLALPAQAQTPPVDLISNNDFENPATPLGFEPNGADDGSVAHTTVNPISGTGSLKITVHGYGRIVKWHQYGYGSGPFARSVILSAKLRADSSTVPGRQLTACAIAYFLDSPEPASFCRNFPVDPNNVVDIRLALDTQD